MLSLAPLVTFLLTVGSPAPLIAPPPVPAPLPAAPAVCRIEVRLKDASQDAAGRAPDRIVTCGTLEIHGGKALYRTGQRIPVVTYNFKESGWTASTTFQSTGVTLQLKETLGPRGERSVTYECRVSCVLDVVGGVTPLFGEVSWSGAGSLNPGKPIVLTALTHIDGRLRRYPKNHPLSSGEDAAPLPDRVVEFETRIEIVAPGAPPAKRG